MVARGLSSLCQNTVDNILNIDKSQSALLSFFGVLLSSRMFWNDFLKSQKFRIFDPDRVPS